jgi:hypothetical protein
MADRDILLSDLNDISEILNNNGYGGWCASIRKAVAMLKEPEAVEPTLIREGRNKHYNDYVCPRCDNVVVYEQNYCSECGVQFLWEGR